MVVPLSKSTDVFVVGGGPAGLATAIAARRRGLSVMVADGGEPPIDKPCGEGLMPDGLEALHSLGVTIPETEAYPFRGIRFVSGGRNAAATFPCGVAYGIRRTNLHRVMMEAASACGVAMLWQSVVTGLHPNGIKVNGDLVRARWVVGADGTSSRVRHWAGLDLHQKKELRFAFRRHYHVAPYTDFMELHWGRLCQIYVTPIAADQICVALISESPKLRLEEALGEFPELSERLRDAEHASTERGAITVNRKLQRVYRGNTALVGDASGGVDAITGEGLCLAFRQAALLADCLAEENLARYQREHRKLARRPALMARLMLTMAKQKFLRDRTMRAFESSPQRFAGMLAMHVGAGSARDYVANGISLGWGLLHA